MGDLVWQRTQFAHASDRDLAFGRPLDLDATMKLAAVRHSCYDALVLTHQDTNGSTDYYFER
jgi:hypothetical protein